MRLSDFKVLTFDTYGTLIDWETGIFKALSPLLTRLAEPPSREAALERFGEIESALEVANPSMIYSDMLAAVYRSLAQSWGVEAGDAEAVRFGGSVGDWPAFADSRDALAYLKNHFKLVTLTNCDRVSYRGSHARLGNPLDVVITAQDVGSYKPARRNFEVLLERVKDEFGGGPSDILHVAQSLYHDHVPAIDMGLATAWIDRRHGAAGRGATKAPRAGFSTDRIAFRFTSMADLVRAHRAELAG